MEESLHLPVKAYDGLAVGGHRIEAPPYSPHFQIAQAGVEMQHAGNNHRQKFRGRAPVCAQPLWPGSDAEHDLILCVLVEIIVVRLLVRYDIHDHGEEEALNRLCNSSFVGIGVNRQIRPDHEGDLPAKAPGGIHNIAAADFAPIGDNCLHFALICFDTDNLSLKEKVHIGLPGQAIEGADHFQGREMAVLRGKCTA